MEAKQLLQNLFGKVEYYLTNVDKPGPVNPPPKGEGGDWIMSNFCSAGGCVNIMWVRNNDKL
jgi:hypothetical protein